VTAGTLAGMAIVPVLLSGGSGTRLWPLSRASAPKQLQRLLGDETMVQATIRRLQGLRDVRPPLVVCNHAHVEPIVTQLAEIGVEPTRVLAEPEGRNTAPAVVAAALVTDPDDVLLILPADHVIVDVEGFHRAVERAVAAAADGSLVTFGIKPTRPETGYGYIRAAGHADEAVTAVEAFVEKPDPETAAAYLASGRYLWNSGMFVFRADALLDEARRLAPEIVGAVEAALDGDGGTVTTLGPRFGDAPSISIDYAVMERTDRAKVVPMDVGWSDVGSWNALWEIETRDPQGNVARGDVVLHGVERSYVRAESRLVAVVGLTDVVVVETADAVLVLDREAAQDVRMVVERLRDEGRPEVERPPAASPEEGETPHEAFGGGAGD